MRFTLQLPTDRVDAPGEFVSGEAVARVAREAEAAGFDACFVTDHPFPPDDWMASGGHHTLDPFVALSFAAAATRRIRLQTHILVLAYRNPFLTAKAVASLDVLSGGRVIVGVAAGYLEKEFNALGADYAHRNEVADEAIRAMKNVWTDAGIRLEGRHFKVDGQTALPRPLQQPHPPLWVGGNAPRAIRRAVELGDGWLPFPAPAKLAGRLGTRALESMDDLARGLDTAREHAAKIGRQAPLDVCFTHLGLRDWQRGRLDGPGFRAGVKELEKLGVTWLTVTLPCRSRSELLETLVRFSEEVIRP